MGNRLNNLYEFEEFRFDADTGTLWRGDEIISLPPKASGVLQLLIENKGNLVSKKEILNTVWADTFVEDGVLTQSIYLLRQTLGAGNAGKQFIKTIARRGYRFGVPIKIVETGEIPAPVGKNLKDDSAGDARTILAAEFLETNAPASGKSLAEYRFSRNELSAPQTPEKAGFRRFLTVRNKIIAGFAVLIFIATGVIAFQILVRSGQRSETQIAPIEQLRFQRLTDFGDVIYPTISPNGELLAYVRHEEEEESVWVTQIATDSTLRILPPSRKGYASLTFSPDGKYLYFREEAHGSPIFQTTALGAPPKRVAENVWGDFSVSPDGRQFGFVRRDVEKNAYLLILVNIDGSGERELTSKPLPMDLRGTPAWSPDGTKLVVAAGIQAQFFPKLLMIDVSNGAETELQTPRWRAIPRALWMPNGKHLIVSAREANEPSSQIWMLSPVDGAVRRLTNDLEGYFWLSLSADGQKLVTRQQRIVSHLWLLPDGDIKKAKQLTFGSRSLDGYAGSAWTAGGKIIFTGFADNVTDLYAMNPDGGGKVQLTANTGQDNTNPSVSNDGKFVVFTSNRTGTMQIWRMDVDGRNQKQLTFEEEKTARILSPVFSKDGKEVFFIKRGTAADGIWKVPFEGGTPAPAAQLGNAKPDGFLSISPDGRWLAYRHIATQPEPVGEIPTMRIGVIAFDGSSEPKIFDLPLRRPFLHWTRDSAGFDYSAGNFNASSLIRQSLVAGESKKIIEFPDRLFDFSWSPDGKNLVTSRGSQQGDAILITNLP
jgi:Tol biopolymer transport system component/DNA-binding winged helix-turn-helix (wHTH) protein